MSDEKDYADMDKAMKVNLETILLRETLATILFEKYGELMFRRDEWLAEADDILDKLWKGVQETAEAASQEIEGWMYEPEEAD